MEFLQPEPSLRCCLVVAVCLLHQLCSWSISVRTLVGWEQVGFPECGFVLLGLEDQAQLEWCKLVPLIAVKCQWLSKNNDAMKQLDKENKTKKTFLLWSQLSDMLQDAQVVPGDGSSAHGKTKWKLSVTLNPANQLISVPWQINLWLIYLPIYFSGTLCLHFEKSKTFVFAACRRWCVSGTTQGVS